MITGCYKTVEIFFVVAPNQILAMYAHFKNMGPGNSSPYKSGTIRKNQHQKGLLVSCKEKPHKLCP